jgi:intracellular septation protein
MTSRRSLHAISRAPSQAGPDACRETVHITGGSMSETESTREKVDLAPLFKLILELGPLVIFFLTNTYYGIFVATGAFMTATAISLTVSKLLLKRVPVLALVTGVFVIVFGALTIYLENETFIKVKPTIVNVLFATMLFTGLYFRRPLLKYALGEVLRLEDEGWRLLTIRWAFFFAFLAVLNEIVWRNFSTDTWVSFKVFGIMPLTFMFMMSQFTLIVQYQVIEKQDEKTG